MTEGSINDIISAVPTGGTAALPVGEFEGPLVIDRAMKLVGNNTTIWARHGSVITVNSPGVTLEGLRVELTEGDVTETAIQANYPTAISNVEILGAVNGFGSEDGMFDIPRTLALGELSAQENNTFRMTVNIPAPAEISCCQGGVQFLPERLPAGRSDVRIIVSAPGTPGLIYTELLLVSQFQRRIYLTGRFSPDTPAAKERVIFTANSSPDYTAAASGIPMQPPGNTPAPGVGIPAPASFIPSLTVNDPRQAASRSITIPREAEPVPEHVPLPNAPTLVVKRGQRVPVMNSAGSSFSVYLTGHKLGDVDIDPYAFLLNESGKCPNERDLVFFGNASSPDGAVQYSTEDGRISVDLGRLSPSVKRIVVAYSVYSGDARRNFSRVSAPVLSLYAQGRERVSFPIDGLTNEITIVAAELYIYKGEWRLSAVGSGYRDGLVKLCSQYGIEAST